MPNGSNKLLSGVYRISDYLDKQAIREKENKKEKFLQVLPTYLEHQISGIEDEKTLLSTIPKLSAQMYQYGADVGSAANQILGNLAQTKYKELAVTSADQQRKAEIDVIKDVCSKFDLGGKTTDELFSTLEGKYGKNVTPDMLKTVLEASTFQKTGAISRDDGQVYYNTYSVNPATGEQRPGTAFRIEKDKSGGFYMDDPKTNINENLPLPMEAMKSLSDQQEWEYRLKKQLEKQLTYQASAYELSLRKQDEARQNQIKKTAWKDTGTGEAIFPEFDTEGNISFYKKQKTEGVGAIGAVDIKVPFEDLNKIEKVGEFGQMKQNLLTPSQIDQDSQNKNRTLQGIGDQILAAEVPESGFGFTGAVDEEDIVDTDPRTGAKFYNRGKVEDIVKKNPDHEVTYLGIKMKLIDVWNIYLDLETKSQISTTGVTPGPQQPIRPKSKW